MLIPRSEYPRPQMVRDAWVNLNGQWEFQFDHGRTGRERGVQKAEHLDSTILVPFCPESRLSGIGYVDWMAAVWYHRTVTLNAEQLGGRVILHFGAVDYHSILWINNRKVGSTAAVIRPLNLM